MDRKIPVAITVNVTGELFLTSLFAGLENRPKTRSIGQYGLNRGLRRVLDAAGRFGIPCTFFVPGRVAELYPDEIRGIAGEGHELANHGFNHENFADFTYGQQVELLKMGNAALESLTGETPVGFRAPIGDLTMDTLRALRDMGFLYSSSMLDDDDLYLPEVYGGENRLVEIPVKWPLYDLPYFMLSFNPPFPTGQSRVAQYTRVLENWKLEYDGAERYHIPYILQVDTQTIAKPGRIGLLEEIIQYIVDKGTAEFFRLRQMAEAFARGASQTQNMKGGIFNV